MRREIVPIVCLLAGAAGGTVATRSLDRGQPTVAVRAASVSAPSFVPACPHLFYAVDGTISPLFCSIDNPAALRYYAAALKPLLALGPNATPVQVATALAKEDQVHNGHAITGTNPIQCEVYQLAAHRWQWNFAAVPIPYCS